MGGTQSATCKQPLNPDLYSVFTLSDSAVQRLPLDADDSSLDREQRSQNIDDFWRDRLECLDQTFCDSKRITDQEFQRLEYVIKNQFRGGSGKPFCTRGLDETVFCYRSYPDETLNCRRAVEKLQLCLNTMMQEASKKRFLESKQKDKKPC